MILVESSAWTNLLRATERPHRTLRRLLGAGEEIAVTEPVGRVRVPVLHADRDFDAIARHTPLEVVPLDA